VLFLIFKKITTGVSLCEDISHAELLDFINSIRDPGTVFPYIEFRNYLVNAGVPLEMLRFYGDFWDLHKVLYRSHENYMASLDNPPLGYQIQPAEPTPSDRRLDRVLSYNCHYNYTGLDNLQAISLDIDTIEGLNVLGIDDGLNVLPRNPHHIWEAALAGGTS